MSNYKILLGEYNKYLISRIFAQSITQKLIEENDKKLPVSLDFEGVSVVTLSFATELFFNLNTLKVNLEILNANPYVQDVLDFAQSSEKQYSS